MGIFLDGNDGGQMGLVDAEVKFDAAVEICSAMGGKLAEPRTMAEVQPMRDLVLDYFEGDIVKNW